MLNKVRASLVDPAQLINYRKDSLFKVWAYLLFFAVLMSTSTLINIINYQGINQRLQNEIRDSITPLETNCEISSGVLMCDDEVNHEFINLDNMVFYINTEETLTLSNYQGFRYHFVLHEDQLNLIFMGNLIRTKPISELHEDFQDFDLTYDQDTRSAFLGTLYDTINQEVLALRIYWGPVLMITSILSGLFLFSVFVIFNTFISRARVKEVSFKHMYVMMSYAATALYIVLIFESLLRFNIFLFIVLLFISFRQMTKLTLEIYIRLNKQ